MKKTRKTGSSWVARIEGGVLYFEDVRQADVESDAFREIIEKERVIRVESLDYTWQQKVWIGDFLATETFDVQMTLRSELRSGTVYWYAYKRVFNKLYKRFVGQSDTINNRRLLDVARRFPGNLR